VLLAQVAAAALAGADPREAWRVVAGLHTDDLGVPRIDDVQAALGGNRRHAAAVVTACRLAAELGAPLAGVLAGIRSALEHADEAEAARAAASAGPRASARMLTGLPVVGLGLGWVLGADLGLLVTDRIGLLAVLTGGGLLLLGRCWTAALVRRAEAAGGR